ncbi:hypothetical protein J2T14_003135 [Paenibacillus harenae]|nr:hypothetical protein [Paenibacillus harenae]
MLRTMASLIIIFILLVSIGCSQKNEVFTIEGMINNVNITNNSITIDKYGELFVDKAANYQEGQSIRAIIEKKTSNDVWDADLLEVLEIELIQ